jgi:hypothetical protein
MWRRRWSARFWAFSSPTAGLTRWQSTWNFKPNRAWLYVRHTGKDYETIERSLDRDYFLSADDAKAFGIVDEVIAKRHAADDKLERLAPVT